MSHLFRWKAVALVALLPLAAAAAPNPAPPAPDSGPATVLPRPASGQGDSLGPKGAGATRKKPAFLVPLRPTLAWRAPIDLPVTLGAGALFAGLSMGAERQAVQSGVAPQAGPGGIDRLAVLELREEFLLPSDLVLLTGVGLGVAASAVDGWWDDGAPWARLLLFAEALAVNGALTELAKYAVRRPRPYTYRERLGVVDDDLSFFSGHTSNVAAATFFAARSIDVSGEVSAPLRVALYGGAGLLTLAVAALRVAAGKHWPSDVLTGAVVGGSVGFLVPELHRHAPVRALLLPTPHGGSVAVAGSF
ncbi:MAG: phosphatase PAP2 family protein [Deltaproteobacteria bacterium]|nr:MAG: phosphatase PAP2 family protein [Deltaproteobacteria bacterium]